MRFIVNKLVSVIKKEEFNLDPHIPIFYLLNLLFQRGMMILWGIIRTRKVNFISLRSTIKCNQNILWGQGISVASGVYIDALASEKVVFGSRCSFGRNVSIECTGSIKDIGRGVTLGDSVGIGSHSFLGAAGGIKIGNDTIIGNFVSFHSENHNFNDLTRPIRVQGVNRQGISVGQGCWIGAKVTLLDGAHIGDHVVVASGAVVKAGIYPSFCILGGVPAKVIKELK